MLGVSKVAVGAGLTVIVFDVELKTSGIVVPMSVATTLNVYEPTAEKLLKVGNVITIPEPALPVWYCVLAMTLPAGKPFTVALEGPLTYIRLTVYGPVPPFNVTE